MNTSIFMPFARLMMGWIFIPSGLSKLFDLETTATYISATAGLPMPDTVGLATGIFEVSLPSRHDDNRETTVKPNPNMYTPGLGSSF